MKVCCVEGCDATAKQDITYFQFPIKPALRRKWREVIRLTTKLTSESLVCSQHFTEDDIETARGRVRLKGRVVPSIFHRKDSPSPKEKTPDTNGNSEPQNEHTEEPNVDVNQCNENSFNENVINEINRENYHNEFSIEDDDDAEKCTIECIPEAILHHDSDTNSDIELNKEDIEDIIANYHIKQDKKLAERLKASIEENQEINQVNDNKYQDNQVSGNKNQDNQVSDNKIDDCGNKNQEDFVLCACDDDKAAGCDKHNENDRGNRDGSDRNLVSGNKNRNNGDKYPVGGKCGGDKTNNLDCEVFEVEFQPSDREKEPHFVEISVGGETARDGAPGSPNNDCLMLLEDVQVDIDPSLLLGGRDSELSSPVDIKSENPISLLTSSDDDDVIIEEPQIDTVEVSDEDEDDLPLNKLVPTTDKKDLTKMLWGTLKEYYCFTCGFKTTNRAEGDRHREAHSKVIQICDICKFTTASEAQFIRHKKKHREEKRFKCHLCDYKARHNMSLVYHLKSHEGRNLNPFADVVPLRHYIKKIKRVKCLKCKAGFSSRKDMMKHYKSCKKITIFKCDVCSYATKRKSDLKRHKNQVHINTKRKKVKPTSEDNDDGDYVPN